MFRKRRRSNPSPLDLRRRVAKIRQPVRAETSAIEQVRFAVHEPSGRNGEKRLIRDVHPGSADEVVKRRHHDEFRSTSLGSQETSSYSGRSRNGPGSTRPRSHARSTRLPDLVLESDTGVRVRDRARRSRNGRRWPGVAVTDTETPSRTPSPGTMVTRPLPAGVSPSWAGDPESAPLAESSPSISVGSPSPSQVSISPS